MPKKVKGLTEEQLKKEKELEAKRRQQLKKIHKQDDPAKKDKVPPEPIHKEDDELNDGIVARNKKSRELRDKYGALKYTRESASGQYKDSRQVRLSDGKTFTFRSLKGQKAFEQKQQKKADVKNRTQDKLENFTANITPESVEANLLKRVMDSNKMNKYAADPRKFFALKHMIKEISAEIEDELRDSEMNYALARAEKRKAVERRLKLSGYTSLEMQEEMKNYDKADEREYKEHQKAIKQIYDSKLLVVYEVEDSAMIKMGTEIMQQRGLDTRKKEFTDEDIENSYEYMESTRNERIKNKTKSRDKYRFRNARQDLEEQDSLEMLSAGDEIEEYMQLRGELQRQIEAAQKNEKTLNKVQKSFEFDLDVEDAKKPKSKEEPAAAKKGHALSLDDMFDEEEKAELEKQKKEEEELTKKTSPKSKEAPEIRPAGLLQLEEDEMDVDADYKEDTNYRKVRELLEDIAPYVDGKEEASEVNWDRIRSKLQDLLIYADRFFTKAADKEEGSGVDQQAEAVKGAVGLAIKLDLWSRGLIESLEDMDDIEAYGISDRYIFGETDPFAKKTQEKHFEDHENEHFRNEYHQDFLSAATDFDMLVKGKKDKDIQWDNVFAKLEEVSRTGVKYIQVLENGKNVFNEWNMSVEIGNTKNMLREAIAYDFKHRGIIRHRKDLTIAQGYAIAQNYKGGMNDLDGGIIMDPADLMDPQNTAPEGQKDKVVKIVADKNIQLMYIADFNAAMDNVTDHIETVKDPKQIDWNQGLKDIANVVLIGTKTLRVLTRNKLEGTESDEAIKLIQEGITHVIALDLMNRGEISSVESLKVEEGMRLARIYRPGLNTLGEAKEPEKEIVELEGPEGEGDKKEKDKEKDGPKKGPDVNKSSVYDSMSSKKVMNMYFQDMNGAAKEFKDNITDVDYDQIDWNTAAVCITNLVETSWKFLNVAANNPGFPHAKELMNTARLYIAYAIGVEMKGRGLLEKPEDMSQVTAIDIVMSGYEYGKYDAQGNIWQGPVLDDKTREQELLNTKAGLKKVENVNDSSTLDENKIMNLYYNDYLSANEEFEREVKSKYPNGVNWARAKDVIENFVKASMKYIELIFNTKDDKLRKRGEYIKEKIAYAIGCDVAHRGLLRDPADMDVGEALMLATSKPGYEFGKYDAQGNIVA